MSFCTNCGAELEEDSRFCPSCGTSVRDAGLGERENPATERGPVSQGSNGNSRVFMILGWICAGISLFFIPILFGAGGVILGYLYRKTDQTHGTIIIIASIAIAIFGMLLGAAVGGSYYYY